MGRWSGIVGYPLIPALLGAMATFSIAYASTIGTSELPSGPGGAWNWLEDAPIHRGLIFRSTLGVGGMVCLFLAWSLARAFRGRALRLILLSWLLPLLYLPPGAGDPFNYVEQGWVVLQGADPTVVPAGSIRGPYSSWTGSWDGTTVGYPPMALAFQAAMVWLSGGSSWVALLLTRVPPAIGLAALWWAMPRLAVRFGLPPDKSRWFVCLNPLVISLGMVGAHHDLLAAGLASVGVVLLVRRGVSNVCGVVLLLVATATKPQAALLVGLAIPAFLGRTLNAYPWRKRQLFELAATGLATIGVVGSVALLSKAFPFGSRWTSPTGDPSWGSSSAYSVLGGLSAEVRGLTGFMRVWSAHALPICCVVVGVVLLIVAVTHRFDSVWWIPAVTTVALTVVGPAGRGWYLIPAVVACGLSGWRARHLMAVQSVLATAFVLESYIPRSYLTTQAIGWGSAAVLGAVLALGLRSTPRRLVQPRP